MKQLFNMFFTFKGRLNRLRYFIYLTPLAIIYITISLNIINLPTTSITFYLLSIALSISGFSVSIRRLHDLNLNGWLSIIHLIFAYIPVLNIIAYIFGFYLLVEAGTKGPNRYGEDPLGGNDFC